MTEGGQISNLRNAGKACGPIKSKLPLANENLAAYLSCLGAALVLRGAKGIDSLLLSLLPKMGASRETKPDISPKRARQLDFDPQSFVNVGYVRKKSVHRYVAALVLYYTSPSSTQPRVETSAVHSAHMLLQRG